VSEWPGRTPGARRIGAAPRIERPKDVAASAGSAAPWRQPVKSICERLPGTLRNSTNTGSRNRRPSSASSEASRRLLAPRPVRRARRPRGRIDGRPVCCARSTAASNASSSIASRFTGLPLSFGLHGTARPPCAHTARRGRRAQPERCGAVGSGNAGRPPDPAQERNAFNASPIPLFAPPRTYAFRSHIVPEVPLVRYSSMPSAAVLTERDLLSHRS
jgi:hypothetical protein